MAKPHMHMAIDSKVMDLLVQSNALDNYPTNVDWIVDCANLVVDGQVDLAHHKQSFLAKLAKPLENALIDLRGFVDRRQRRIYVDQSMMDSRKKFVKLHETGHIIIPWQDKMLSADNDDTLHYDYIKEEFEAEANYFASAAFFQLDRFDKEVRRYGLGVKAAQAISKRFGASIHATLRRMVEFHGRRCALLVLENRTQENCSPRDVFLSESFATEFGEVMLPDKLDEVFLFAADYLRGRKMQLDKNVSLPTRSGILSMKYDFFFNGYNGFVFIYPDGELPRPRVNYVIEARG